MVRKKPSRAPSRAKPQPPLDASTGNIDEEERQCNLKKRLEDFDRKVIQIVQQMESDKKDILDSIKNFYFVDEINTPSDVNKMLWRDFLHRNDPSYSVKSVVRESISTIINEAETQLIAKTVRKKEKMVKMEQTPLRRSARTQKKDVPNIENIPPPTGSKTTRKRKNVDVLSTPANSFNPMNQMMVTPKFDPKTPLPMSTLRKAKPGEVVMSLKGSPVQLGTKEWLENLSNENLDDHTKQELQDMQNQLAKLLEINIK